jgi:hypothetical protein
VISVTPSSLNFGSVASGVTVTNTFTIQNTGGGTLAGTATVAAPFRIVSGGTYSLGGRQIQTVSVSYSPSGSNSSQVVTFTGGGGATATVSGSLLAVLSGLSFESYAGVITSPFSTNGGYVSQSVPAADVASGGSASYYFNITNAGQYIVQASVLAPNSGTKSFWVNMAFRRNTGEPMVGGSNSVLLPVLAFREPGNWQGRLSGASLLRARLAPGWVSFARIGKDAWGGRGT